MEIRKVERLPELEGIVSVYSPVKELYEESQVLFVFSPKEKVVYRVENPGEKDFQRLEGLKLVGHDLHLLVSWVKYVYGISLQVSADSLIMMCLMQFKDQDLIRVGRAIAPELRADEGVLKCLYPMYFVQKYKALLSDKIFKIEMNFFNLAVSMRVEGIRVDRTNYSKVITDIQEKISKLKNSIYDKTGKNPDSRQGIEEIIKASVKDNVEFKKTKTGAVTTSLEYIELLLSNYNCEDSLRELCDYKHLTAVMKTAKKLLNLLIGGNLHPIIKQIGYDGTARVFSASPSVNQFSNEVRYSFVPEMGKKFVFFDWNSVELYLACYWSKCEKILQWVESGEDIHKNIAREVFHMEEISKKERELSKKLSYSVIYGISPKTFAEEMNITIKEASELMERYRLAFPELFSFKDKILRYTEKTGNSISMLGRTRRIEGINSRDYYERSSAERKAFNTAIQSSCADFFKLTCLRLSKRYKVVYGVFDSFLLEVDANVDIREVVAYIDKCCDYSANFANLRLRYKVKEGYNWKECLDG